VAEKNLHELRAKFSDLRAYFRLSPFKHVDPLSSCWWW